MARTLLDLDDNALARAAAVLGTTSKVDTVNTALRLIGTQPRDEEDHRRFDDLLTFLGDRLTETDVRAHAWR